MSSREKPLRVGLVGLGSMGRNHARVLINMPETELVGIVDPAAAGQNHLGVPVTGDLDEVLASGLDYCVIATPTSLHLEVGSALAHHGIPCLIEKPLATNAADANRLADTFAARGVAAAVGHIERYNPAIAALRRHLQEGTLGQVFQLATRRLSPLPTRIGDVGVTLDLATHDIDSTRFVLDSEYAEAHALSHRQPGRPHEDAIAVLGTMADGTIVNHLVNWLSPLKERVTVVTGEKGMLVADTVLADLTLHANGAKGSAWHELAQFGGVIEGDVTRFALSKVEPLRAEHEDFIAHLRDEPNAVCSLTDAVATVLVAERLRDESSYRA